MKQPTERRIFDDAERLAEHAADEIVRLAQAAIGERGEFTLCASGGSTPRAAYEQLARPARARAIDWQRTQIFFGDERCVPPTDPASNYRMLKLALLDHVPIPEANVFRVPTGWLPEMCARSYEDTLRYALGEDAAGWPARPFDVMLLGMGSDGHTASLFPGSTLEAKRWASARQHPVDHSPRVTLTEPVLNRAAVSLFLVTGSEKAERLAEVLEGPHDPVRLPAQRIAPSGRLGFWIDRAAAARLRRPAG